MSEEDARADELGGAPLDRQEGIPKVGHRPADEPERGWKVPVLAALAVVGLASAATFGFLYMTAAVAPEEVSTYLDDERPEVSERARQVADLLLNYDSTNLEDVSAQMLGLSTGNFREQYAEVLSSGAGLGSALEEASASSRGQILDDPDVAFRGPAEAFAILRVTQTTQSNSNPQGRTFEYVLKITLVDTTDGGWKADRVEILSAQES